MRRTLRHSLFALAALAIAALSAHMVDCVFAADHSASISRSDLRAIETVVAKADTIGSSSGRGPLQIEKRSLSAFAMLQGWNPSLAAQATPSRFNNFEHAAGRNTSLMHRRAVVLVI